jgi:hypothetical protein
MLYGSLPMRWMKSGTAVIPARHGMEIAWRKGKGAEHPFISGTLLSEKQYR